MLMPILNATISQSEEKANNHKNHSIKSNYITVYLILMNLVQRIILVRFVKANLKDRNKNIKDKFLNFINIFLPVGK